MSRIHIEQASAPNWNHNVAYHPWLARQLSGVEPGRVLDVGSGAGVFAAGLARAGFRVVGIDPDARAVANARENYSDPRFVRGDFLMHDFGKQQFDAVTCVATLHHMDAESALTKARDLLRPGGVLDIVGLVKPSGPVDLGVEAIRVLPALLGSRVLHREQPDPLMRTAEPQLSFAQLRSLAWQILEIGVRIHRRLYYRYTLSWRKPTASPGIERLDRRRSTPPRRRSP